MLLKGERNMKNLRKFSVLAIVLALVFAFTACGTTSNDEEGEAKIIRVAASPTPHAEILNSIADNLADEGWTLEVVEFDDYVQPNVATSEGDVDANYFQHVPYLEQYNEENGTELVAVGNVHYEAMGAYKGTKASFDELADGDKIAVPNDVTNEARALQLLAANGVLTLKDGVGLEATKTDIVDNPKNIEIVELEAATIPASLPDVAIGVINANYALGAGLTTEDAVAYEAEDSEAAETYVNVIVVNAGNEDTEQTKALVAAIQTEKVKEFIAEQYKGAVQAKF
jgi:D-methionine transport system substrate-binding protein